jgi:hypothetical protein
MSKKAALEQKLMLERVMAEIAEVRANVAKSDATAVAKQVEALSKRQAEMEARSTAAQREELARARVQYARRAGAKLDDEVLGRVLPDVDVNTADGRQAIEQFRSANASLFSAPPPSPGDITKGLVASIASKSEKLGQKMPIEERKVFGVKLVKSVIAKNLGGEA